jgi:hypothetical protein
VRALNNARAGSALFDSAMTLLGDVRFTGQGGLETGRKHISLFDMHIDLQAVGLRDRFLDQLTTHHGIISAFIDNPSRLRTSYRELRVWTYHVRGGPRSMPPWNDDMYFNVKTAEHKANGVAAGGEVINDRTMDAMAWLWIAYQQNPQRIENDWHIADFINELIRYEVYLYSLDMLGKLHQNLVDASKKEQGSAAGEAAAGQKAMEQYKAAITDLETAVVATESKVVKLLPKINTYLRRGSGGTVPSGGASAGKPVITPVPLPH